MPPAMVFKARSANYRSASSSPSSSLPSPIPQASSSSLTNGLSPSDREHFHNFLGQYLPTLVSGDRSCVVQLASQQPLSSSVYRAWRECNAKEGVVEWLNRPLALPPLLLMMDTKPNSVTACALDTSGDFVALGFKSGRVSVRSLAASGEQRWSSMHTPQNPESPDDDTVTDRVERVTALSFYRNPRSGALALASAADICVRLWDASSGSAGGVLNGHVYVTNPGGGADGKAPEGPCQCKHYLLDGKWSRQRHGVCTQLGHSGTLNGLAVSRTGELLATCADDWMVKLWSLEQRAQLHTMHAHKNNVQAVAFGPTGEMLVSGAEDACCLVWRWQTTRGAPGVDGSVAAAPSEATTPSAAAALPAIVGTTPPVLVACVRLPWSECTCLALSADAHHLVAVATPLMTSNAKMKVYDLRHASPPVDAAFHDTLTAALARGDDAAAYLPQGAHYRPEFAARQQLQQCVRRYGVPHVPRHFTDSEEVEEESGRWVSAEDGKRRWEVVKVTKVKQPYSDDVQAAFEVELVPAAADGDTAGYGGAASGGDVAGDGGAASGGGAGACPFECVRITERSGGGGGDGGQVLCELTDPCVHTMRSHATSGDEKKLPPACTCKSDWGELVADPACPVRGHAGRIRACAFSSEGDALVSCAAKEVMVWAGAAGQYAPRAMLRNCHTDISHVASAAGRLVTVGGSEVKVWDAHAVVAAGFGEGHLPEGHARRVNQLRIHAASRTVVSCSDDLTAAIWRERDGGGGDDGGGDGGGDGNSGRARSFGGHAKPVRSCDLSPDGRLVATGSEDRYVRVFAAASGELLCKWAHPEKRPSDNGVSAVAFSPSVASRGGGDDDGMALLATASGEGNAIAFWRMPLDGAPPPRLVPPPGSSEEATQLVAQLQATMEREGGPVGGAFHLARRFNDQDTPHSKRPYSAELQAAFAIEVDGTATAGGKGEGAAPGFTRSVLRVRLREAPFSEVGCFDLPLLTHIQGHDSADDGCICHWHRGRKRPAGHCPLVGHSWDIDTLAYCPDGSVLASTSKDFTARLWDAHNGACLRTLEGFGDDSCVAAWSPDGRLLATAFASCKSLGRAPEACAVWWVDTEGASGPSTSLDRAQHTAAHWGSETAALRRLEIQLPSRSGVEQLCWSPSGGRLAVAVKPGDRTGHTAPSGKLALYSLSAANPCDAPPCRTIDTSAGDTDPSASQRADELSAITFVGGGDALLAGVSYEGRCRVWRCADGSCVRTFYADAALTSIVACGGVADCMLAAAGASGAVYLLRTDLSAASTTTTTTTTTTTGPAPPPLVGEAPGVAGEARRVLASASPLGLYQGLEHALATSGTPEAVLVALQQLISEVHQRTRLTADVLGEPCVVCADAPRAVRYKCGHCVCCESCSKRWQAARGGCPVCRKPIVVAEVGPALARERSFVEPSVRSRVETLDRLRDR